MTGQDTGYDWAWRGATRRFHDAPLVVPAREGAERLLGRRGRRPGSGRGAA
ncbi:hypothetical protein [Nonomuraea sp. NPDC050783]|uniref:hypothetical protein n=1 Tax=Nonomuraea sp. NPDC050783 TaxID=3154634 RepID=UPI003466774C